MIYDFNNFLVIVAFREDPKVLEFIYIFMVYHSMGIPGI